MTLLLVSVSSSLLAQVQVLDPPSRAEPSLTERSFVSLYGEVSAVGFQPGALDRAHHFLQRLELITLAFNKWSEVAVPVVGYLVNREQWNDMQMPGIYGIPVRTSATAMVVPAEGDSETVRMWRSILGVDQLPLNPGAPLVGTAEEAASLAIIDVLAQVEAARGFVRRAGLTGDQPWVGEVAAHLAARTLFAEMEPEKLQQIDFVYDRLYERFGGDHQHALTEYRPEGVAGEVTDTETWLWFQGAFARGARVLHEQRGKKAIKQLRRSSSKSSRGSSGSSGGGLDTSQLRQQYPGLDAWLITTFR